VKNIIFYARLVKTVSYILMPIIIINFFIKWFFSEISSDSFIAGFLYNSQPSQYLIATMPLLHRLMAMIIDGISTGLLFMILWLVTEIMNSAQQHEIFSTLVVTQFATISKLAFSLALYEPISRILLSVITTLHNEPGQRVLAVSFVFSDLINILIFGLLMVITLLMQQATSLQNEHNLTV